MKWRDRVQEYVRERGEGSSRNLEQARRKCQDRERWKLFCHGHPLVGAPRSRRQNEQNRIVYMCRDMLGFLDTGTVDVVGSFLLQTALDSGNTVQVCL